MKSKTTAYLLLIFLGWLSAHKFYLGKNGSGILGLVTFQFLGVGLIIDLFTLGSMVEQYNIKDELKTIRSATMANLNNK